ncbi:MAG: metalloregulator ArsR/SmtB family transcription factor [Acidobacteriota bacterium]|nr:metalloregulator ArsR/SmtB family transcription factor [Acidobacteriota bacterium]
MLKRKAQVFKALGHPSRLAMVEALLNGERCVCELQELVGSDMSTVSRHLSVLRNAGLVDDRKDGLKVFYSLRMPCVARFFECVDEVLGSRFGFPG